VTATPLQLASYIATIANGGTFHRPHLVNTIIHTDSKTEEKMNPEIVRSDFISKNNIRIVQEGMRQTVLEGSGRQMGTLLVTSAGKTGTAQFGNDGKLHSWYVSFGPYEKPTLAMVVLIEGGGEGHSWALPATKEIYKWYFDEERGSKEDPDAPKDPSQTINESHQFQGD
jgi:penicillin-binding protein 2